MYQAILSIRTNTSLRGGREGRTDGQTNKPTPPTAAEQAKRTGRTEPGIIGTALWACIILDFSNWQKPKQPLQDHPTSKWSLAWFDHTKKFFFTQWTDPAAGSELNTLFIFWIASSIFMMQAAKVTCKVQTAKRQLSSWRNMIQDIWTGKWKIINGTQNQLLTHYF